VDRIKPNKFSLLAKDATTPGKTGLDLDLSLSAFCMANTTQFTTNWHGKLLFEEPILYNPIPYTVLAQ